MSAIDLEAFRATPLQRDPYDFICVPGFLKAEKIAAISQDFPKIDRPGSFPLGELEYGPSFAALIAEFGQKEIEEAFEEKFGVDLSNHPLMVTARGRCQAKDGRIHPDTKSKVITVLIYMNSKWESDGGRLRILRSDHDLEDYVAEVPPIAGTLLAFRRDDNSFHGHHPFDGERRTIQFNWVVDKEYIQREQRRHRVTARLKSLNPLA
jgi:hypothetical protein